MRVCGGPARSETWNQIKADVTGFTVAVPAVLETAVVGAAIARGDRRSARTRTCRPRSAGMTRVAHRLEPRAELRGRYDAAYDAYVRLHPAIAPILARAARS